MSFLAKYIESNSGPVLIPNITMNAPIVGPNGLGDVGLELELEGRRLPGEGHLERIKAPTGARWTAHPDGSLRGENLEYVLSTPCKIEEVDDMVGNLYAKFTEMNTVLNISNRCSTHVHVNMADKKINQLTAILALWATYEEVLINWCGEERKSNHFCLSTKDSNALINRWNTYLRTGRFDFGEGMKYCALNVRNLYGIGSFEFRCMSASEDLERITDWAKFVHGLCEFASEEFSDPRNMAPALSERGTIELFADICRRAKTSPKFFDSVLHHENNNHFDKIVMEGFRRAQQLVLGHPWEEWIEEINKVYVPSPFGTKKKTANPNDDLARRLLDEMDRDEELRRQARAIGGGLRIGGDIFRAEANNARRRGARVEEDQAVPDAADIWAQVPAAPRAAPAPANPAAQPVGRQPDPFIRVEAARNRLGDWDAGFMRVGDED